MKETKEITSSDFESTTSLSGMSRAQFLASEAAFCQKEGEQSHESKG